MKYQENSFDELIQELAADLVNAPASDIANAIQNGLERIADLLDLQYAALNLFSAATNKLKNSFAYMELGTGVDVTPRDDLPRHFPWFTRMSAEGRSYIISAIPDGFPPEATAEREYCLRYGITSTIMLTIQIGGNILGSMNFWTNRGPRDWPEGIVSRLRFIGKVFANALFRQQAESDIRSQLQFEMLLSRLSTLFINLPSGELQQQFNQALQFIVELLGMDRGNIFERRAEDDEIVLTHSWTVDGAEPTGREITHSQFPWIVAQLEQGETVVVPSTKELPVEAKTEREHCQRFGIKTVVAVPLQVAGKFHGAITISSSREEKEWSPHLIQRFRVFGDIIANAVSRHLSDKAMQATLAENQRLQEQLQAENYYLRQEVSDDSHFRKIIGQSDTLKYVLFRVGQVAESDATVLILGETGTGKGLVAHAIHQKSARKDHPFITVNCAALPANLIESELFGREKGAYTGAHERQLGRFDIANRGTIFLDEIGDLSLELQAKLLRVVQDGEFERLGSPRTIKVDVRIIAATSRDIRDEIHQKRFREDLFYRLNVFPITLPPLRKRKEDIPLLINEFVNRYARKMGKKISSVSSGDMAKLQEYSWPGNIRELEGIVERLVITTQGPVLRLGETLDHVGPVEEYSTGGDLQTVERKHIRKVLEQTGWKIEGPGGAAEVLKMKPSTLRARLHKLNIRRTG